MQFLEEDDLQSICIQNLICLDKFCQKVHPRAFAGVCIGFLQGLCENQQMCDLLHLNLEQLQDKIQQHPINGIRQYNLCPTKCEQSNCRFEHPPWLKNICLICLNKKKNCKEEKNLIHKLNWNSLREIVYKEYSINGLNPELFCDNINCNCEAKKYNFDRFCIQNFKGVCPMLMGRCIKQHIRWENMKDNKIYQEKQKEMVAQSCIKFDSGKQNYIKQKQPVMLQVFIQSSQLSTIVNQIEQRPQVDIIFLIDCTISMEKWLLAAKQNIKYIIQEFTKKISVSSCVRIAAVCYRDFSDGPNHIQYHDFTVSPEEIEKFIDKFEPKGGEDIPEDLIGALEVALKLNISKHPDSILQLFTITDAPCHGQKYHDQIYDSRPDTNNLEAVIQKFIQMKRRFFFSFISISTKKQTDKMESILKECIPNYSSGKITENKFSDYVLFSLSATMKKSSKIEDNNEYLYREAKYRKQQQMDFKFDLRNGTYKEQFQAQMQSTKLSKKRTLLQIEKSELQIHNNEKGQHSQVFKAFDQKNNVYVVLKIPCYIMQKIKTQQPISEELIIKAKKFAKTKYLLQLIAKQLSHYFNQQCRYREAKFIPIYYATPYLYKLDIPFYGLKVIYGESYIDLDVPWVKYSNNTTFCLKDHNFTTFSHFSYNKTYQQLMITDLQGKYNLLTDPSIHSKNIEDEGNCEEDSYLNFFSFQHPQCTSLCKQLELPVEHIQSQGINSENIIKQNSIEDKFGGLISEDKLYKICVNCNAQEKINNINDYIEKCKACLEKQEQLDEYICDCCQSKYKCSTKYRQVLETVVNNLCQLCQSSQCLLDHKCVYCKSIICNQTSKQIVIEQNIYYICIDGFHYLRQIRCQICSKEYKNQRLLTEDEYCNNKYVCNECKSKQLN